MLSYASKAYYLARLIDRNVQIILGVKFLSTCSGVIHLDRQLDAAFIFNAIVEVSGGTILVVKGPGILRV